MRVIAEGENLSQLREVSGTLRVYLTRDLTDEEIVILEQKFIEVKQQARILVVKGDLEQVKGMFNKEVLGWQLIADNDSRIAWALGLGVAVLALRSK
ncbi:hypothetical protein LCGC14_2574910 [marine sediment metagenome]|uniref:Uncharacterized protein n=1 Tax=marine sediment metagenome TaxID=412755 RepID=A0A0F9CSC5_9ZZZZ